MTNAGDVARRFITAWTSKDFTTARSLLHHDMIYRGATRAFDAADGFLDMLKVVATTTLRADIQQVFVDGDDACVIYDLVFAVPEGSPRMCAWYHTREGKVAEIRLFYDPRLVAGDRPRRIPAGLKA